METTQKTSETARVKFMMKGNKEKHYKVILNSLKLCQYPLTGYGVSERSTLTYYQVMRRMKELELLNLIEQSGTKIDIDGAKRMSYKYIGL